MFIDIWMLIHEKSYKNITHILDDVYRHGVETSTIWLQLYFMKSKEKNWEILDQEFRSSPLLK